jgi:hypothetical protein
MSSTPRSLDIATTRQGSHEPCPCGCSPCADDGCKLECPTRPRFFCGQLLTDQDLEALTGWTRARLALSRYRDGWGVACGLGVRCDPDPKRPAGIIVSPGYAVSCCGEDIVLCEEAKLDLSKACREDPCAEVQRTSLKAEVSRERMVDLYLRYREEPAEPQAAFGRSACKEVSACEPSRVREGYELVWKPAGGDPRQAEADRWQEGYKRCTEVLDQFPAAPWPDAQRWLLRWIDKHPLHHFYFVRDLVCEMTEVSEKLLVRILFLLIQDCRNAFLQEVCHACLGSEDIPLARICLVKEEGRACRICSIDPYPPYRRPLSPAGFPSALGDVNLGPWIWHREEEVCAALANLGVPVGKSQPFVIPTTLDQLRKQLAGPIFASCGKPVVCLQVLDLEPLRKAWKEPCLPGGGRVVGFLCEAKPEPDIDVKAVKDGPAKVGGSTEYSYTFSLALKNTSSADLVLTIADDLHSQLAYKNDTFGSPATQTGQKVQWTMTLAPGVALNHHWLLAVTPQFSSLPQQVTVNNSFTITATKPDGTYVFTRTSNKVSTTIDFDRQTINLDAKRPAPARKRAREKK